jgi:heme exporter protein A
VTPDPDTPSILEARGVHKSFGPVKALRGADIALLKGEVLALFGANGAGKSTLVRCLASLMKPDRGEILVGGKKLSSLPGRDGRGRLGLVAHQSLLYDSLTAEENLVFYGSLYGIASPLDRARTLLREFGLAERAHDAVRGFSRGMQQRLSLARALVHDPEVLLLDEPSTGLDPTASSALLARLARFRQEGRSAIVISHDIASALSISDRFAILSRGRIEAVEPAAGVTAAAVASRFFPPDGGRA